jgi:hypothetical protein
MEHYYPPDSSPKSALGCHPLKVKQMLSLFIVFIVMAIFALLSLFVELIISKTVASRRISQASPPQIKTTTEEAASGGSLVNMMCQVGFDVKVGDANAHAIFIHKLENLLNDYELMNLYHVHYNPNV